MPPNGTPLPPAPRYTRRRGSNPSDGQYEPLIGCIPLQQAQAAVDLVGHRLVKVNRVDLK